MIANSLFLIVTLSPFIAQTQESSQGAGQILPVKSAKGFVRLNRSYASSQRSL